MTTQGTRRRSAIVAECSCGRTFDVVEWARLRHRGFQRVIEDWTECNCDVRNPGTSLPISHARTCAGQPYVIELRDCPCGSTIAKEVSRGTR